MAEDDEIRIRGEFENNVSRPADAAARSIDHLGDEAAGTAVELEALEAAEAGAAAGARDLGNETDRAADRINKNTRSTKKNTDEVKRNERETSRLIRTTRRFGSATQFLGRGLQGVSRMAVSVGRGLAMAFGPLAMFSKIGAMIDAVSVLVVGLKGLGAAGLVAANGLGPLVGILGAYPAAIAGMATGVGTIKLGTAGLGAAWQNMNNPKADKKTTAKANKNVAPEALEFLKAIKKVMPAWMKMRKSIQGKLFKDLSKDIKPLAQIWLPILQKQLGKTASGINDIIQRQLGWMRSAQGIQMINQFLVNGRKNFLAILRVVATLGRVFLMIANQASPMFRRMMGDIQKMLGGLFEWLKKNDRYMTLFFLNSWQRLKGILRTAWQFALGLIGVLKAATPWTNKMGTQLAKVATHFNKWANSKKGQAQLHKFYSEFMPVFYALLGLAGKIITLLWQIGSSKEFLDLIKKIEDDLLPAIGKIVKASQGKFLPAVIDIFTALADIASSGFIEIFAGFLEKIAGYIQKFADWFKRQSPETKKLVVGFIATFLLFGRLLAPLGKGIETFGKLVSRVGGKGGILSKLFGAGKGKGVGEMGKLAGFLARLAPLLGGIASPIGVVVAAIVALLVIFGLLYVKFQGFRDAMGQIGQRFVEVWQGIIVPVFTQVVNALVGLFMYLLSQVGINSLPELGTRIAEAWRAIWPVISWLMGAWATSIGIVIAVIGGLIAAIMLIVFTWIRVAQAVVSFTSRAISTLAGFRAWVFGALLGLFTRIVTGWRSAVAGFTGWIGGVFNGAVSRIGGAIGRIRGFFASAVGAARGIIEGLVSTVSNVASRISGILDGIRSAASNVVSFVGGLIPGRFTGGDLVKGQLTLVGEQGPEAVVGKNGGIGMVGLNGPQLIRPEKDFGIVNAAATENPWSMWSNQSPGWAVKALQKAYSAEGHQSPKSVAPTQQTPTVAPSYDYSTQLTIEHVEVGSKEDLDELEDRLEALLKKIARDKKRNS